MISYNNSNVVQCLRQYDMFANSLNLVKTREEKNMIIKQLTKLEKKIIELTNEVYEEEYYSLANKECGLIEEEQARLNMLIELINQRLSYVEKRCNSHYQLTGESIDVSDVLGASTLDNLEDRIKIIAKYSKNIKLEKELKEEVESLTNKITLATEKIEINKTLNKELEKKFCDLLSSSFEKCGFYELFDSRDEIEYAYYETEKSLTLAELNLETAKTSPVNVLNECQMMLDEVKKDYIKYKEKLSILKLMEMFNREVNTYEELFEKRREINELFRYIKNEEFLDMVMDLATKQYNTILMEQQDVNTYNDLIVEKERKLEVLSEINEENNSERFQEVLEQLIKNEEARQARILEEQRKIEEEEKKKKLEIERKKREEILKRQKIIEEARKKEMEKRTKLLLEQQQKSVLQTNRKDKGVSFETIKDISNKSDVEEKKIIDVIKENKMHEEVKNEEVITFKNKVDIEKELFEEFNSSNEIGNSVNDEKSVNGLIEDKKLPDVSIDEYMKNFNEEEFKENEINSLFNEDDVFPNIPI
ncbi:MAG: hypothetical protein IJE89_02005 [Bacilli bacterium]|nr:hypothetical protein [Bacilli bacterium]